MSIYNEYISLFCCLLDVNIRVKIEMEVVLMKRLGEELVKIIGFAIVACFVMLLVPSNRGGNTCMGKWFRIRSVYARWNEFMCD